MGFWRDGGSVVKIEEQPWWDDLPKIAEEIKLMMPLIRADHKTLWGATCDNKKIIFGTRTVDNLGHMIIANPTGIEKRVTFTLNDLPYKISSSRDYFNKKLAGKIEGNKLMITLAPQSSKVLTLAK